MIRPVTSTRVATKGADDVAGSKPNRRSKKGSIDPAIVPHKTMPIRATPTVSATKGQCGPYRFENADHTVIRRKPIVPRITPSPKPEKISRRITRHQSRKVTSPRANARITSVDACEPELPPEEMM